MQAKKEVVKKETIVEDGMTLEVEYSDSHALYLEMPRGIFMWDVTPPNYVIVGWAGIIHRDFIMFYDVYAEWWQTTQEIENAIAGYFMDVKYMCIKGKGK